jgi:very-short-patch-repair endonuclease
VNKALSKFNMSKKRERLKNWIKKKSYQNKLRNADEDVYEMNRIKFLHENAERMRGSMTKPEKAVSDALNDLGYEHELQKIVANMFIYDIYIPKYRLLIEVDGDYYHGNPNKYTRKELNWGQKKNMVNDIKKNRLAKALKYNIIRFWESDINGDIEDVKIKIKEFISTLPEQDSDSTEKK